MKLMRLFVAVNFPDKIKQSLGSIIRQLRLMPVSASWVREENLHITIQFLGNVPEDRVIPIANALGRAVKGINAFRLKLGGIGVFPSVERPRVLWLGLSGDITVLSCLQRQVQKELKLLDFQPEGRRYSPHLTLARIRSPFGFEDVLEEAKRLTEADSRLVSTIIVDSVELMQSELKPGGPNYCILARIPFRYDR